MRYVTYEPSPRGKLPRIAVGVRITDHPEDVAACARLSTMYDDEESVAAHINAQKHVGKPRNALYVAAPLRGGLAGYGRITWVDSYPSTDVNTAPEGYYLGGMVVHEDYRRRGIGARLTAERLRFIRQRADEAWYLVNSANTASIDLHTAYGFHESTRDFTFPGRISDEPGGILCHAVWGPRAQSCPGCR